MPRLLGKGMFALVRPGQCALDPKFDDDALRTGRLFAAIAVSWTNKKNGASFSWQWRSRA
jgi:hypothetical protein